MGVVLDPGTGHAFNLKCSNLINLCCGLVPQLLLSCFFFELFNVVLEIQFCSLKNLYLCGILLEI